MVEIPAKEGDGEKSYFAGGSDIKCSKSIYMGIGTAVFCKR
jgi:hypothetical protein